jgi:plasmid maintenance system antidote protein VapI
MNTNNLIPARILGIGYFIREQMEYREWDIDTLSNNSGIDILELNLLLNNNKILTDETTKSFANVFGLSHRYWINLDSNSRTKISK